MTKTCKRGHTTERMRADGSCGTCRSEQFKAYWQSLTLEEKWTIQRKSNLIRLYKLTPEMYTAMLRKQDYKCLSCSDVFSGKTNGKARGTFAVDHDHGCCPGQKSCGKCVRGLLCYSCNCILGLAKDSIEKLSHCISYLEYNLAKKTRQAA